jgi:hypothetical protein
MTQTTITTAEKLQKLNQLQAILESYGVTRQKELGEESEMAYSRSGTTIQISYDIDINDVFDGSDKIEGMVIESYLATRTFITSSFPATRLSFN